jgi:hypothetical protein
VCGKSSAVFECVETAVLCLSVHFFKNFIALSTEVRELFYLTVLSIGKIM